MTITLIILGWLLCGFVGSTALFYSPWADLAFDDTTGVTIWQALSRSLLGPLPVSFFLFMLLIGVIDLCCTKTLFTRK